MTPMIVQECKHGVRQLIPKGELVDCHLCKRDEVNRIKIIQHSNVSNSALKMGGFKRLRLMNDFTDRWNDLTFNERSELMPYTIECQINGLLASKEKAIRYHTQHIKSIDEHVENLKRELNACR
jgi:hypothetical protein